MFYTSLIFFYKYFLKTVLTQRKKNIAVHQIKPNKHTCMTKYSTASGARTERKVGVLMLITIIVDSEIKVVCIHADKVEGMALSIISISLENLLVIRPKGVESKNVNFDRRMFDSMS